MSQITVTHKNTSVIQCLTTQQRTFQWKDCWAAESGESAFYDFVNNYYTLVSLYLMRDNNEG